MDFKRRPLIAGNWKMNGSLHTAGELTGFLTENLKRNNLSQIDMLICPPATLLYPVEKLVRGSGLLLGAQDCHLAQKGAHTGDISAGMLQDLGCSHVILGHSERRSNHKEVDDIVRSKVEAAFECSLVAIICVGETEEEYKKGITAKIIENQILNSVPEQASAENTIIAYEPVWAIGTGLTPSTEEIQNVHTLIRKVLEDKIGLNEAGKQRLLYGGSVNPSNAIDLLALADVDGALVGGASLSGKDFLAIAESCPK